MYNKSVVLSKVVMVYVLECYFNGSILGFERCNFWKMFYAMVGRERTNEWVELLPELYRGFSIFGWGSLNEFRIGQRWRNWAKKWLLYGFWRCGWAWVGCLDHGLDSNKKFLNAWFWSSGFSGSVTDGWKNVCKNKRSKNIKTVQMLF